MALAGLNLSTIPLFDVNAEQTSIAQEWDQWTRQFKIYIAAAGITKDGQKRALLLHTAGAHVKDVFATLGDTRSNFETALAALCKTKLDEHKGCSRNYPQGEVGHIFFQTPPPPGHTWGQSSPTPRTRKCFN